MGMQAGVGRKTGFLGSWPISETDGGPLLGSSRRRSVSGSAMHLAAVHVASHSDEGFCRREVERRLSRKDGGCFWLGRGPACRGQRRAWVIGG